MFWRSFPPPARFLAIVAAGSLILILFRSAPEQTADQMQLWTFARNHMLLYEPLIKSWNRDHQPPLKAHLFSGPALERRVLSGFLSGTPTASLIEFERSAVNATFLGPREAIGWTDLTEPIKRDGLDELIVENSFAPWTHNGRIYGLPHDVHPVLLAYRADIIEAAGIDLSQVETWDDYFEALRPLMQDRDGDGHPDHAALSFRLSSGDIENFLLQAGGGLIDVNGEPMLTSPINARVLAHLVIWSSGPAPVTIEAPEFSNSGNSLRLQGRVLGSLMPDWLAGVWKSDLPQLGGKLKLMPLPAWEKGGRRTTVMGGTMLGIPKANDRFGESWKAAKTLYLSEETAVQQFLTTNIITPVKQFWDLPVFSQPDPYFSGQASGQLFIAQAPQTPPRHPSPYLQMARSRVGEAALALRQYARDQDAWTVEALRPVAEELLEQQQARVVREMSRNHFRQIQEVADR